MYDSTLHLKIKQHLKNRGILWETQEDFYTRFMANGSQIHALWQELYGDRSDFDLIFSELITCITVAYQQRPDRLRKKDEKKESLLTQEKNAWFLKNEMMGMSLYVDRFSTNLKILGDKLTYFKDLGINLLHLMPLFESPSGQSDGGYAVSNFQKVDPRFGDLSDLQSLQVKMEGEDIFLMIDLVLNHTSQDHPWALKAKEGDPEFQDYYYFYQDLKIPDQFEGAMPEIFPESAPKNFTFVNEIQKWVMTVFHTYQWDLNYRNPKVLLEMISNIYFYANLGVDILRLDAPAFLWKEVGTACQNLPKVHTILRLIRLCVETATPFGTDHFLAKECDLAYNATQMSLQWDALATGNTQIMISSQQDLLQKPKGCSWITYTRCHDDIGLAYDDYFIQKAGLNPWDHKNFIKNYYTGYQEGSDASGVLFSYNPRNHDSRLSGTLASLCGLEKSMQMKNEFKIQQAIQKILLMQAQSFFIGGIPMVFYGDELGYTNDYSFQTDLSKSYDNRWVHRPIIDWAKNDRRNIEGTVEEIIYAGTRKLIQIRKKNAVFSDLKNIEWIKPYNIHIAGFVRFTAHQKFYCLFNYHHEDAYLTWYAFKERVWMDHKPINKWKDWWEEKEYCQGLDHEYLILKPYSFMILEGLN
jgi:amylosucrase